MVWDLKQTDSSVFATTSTGVFCLKNGNSRWVKCDTAVVHHLSITGNRIYLLSYDHYYVRQSANGGVEWTTRFLPDSIRQVRDWAGKGDTILLTTNALVWRSADGGHSWKSLHISAAFDHAYNAVEVVGDFFYLADRFRVYRSTDGLAWTALAPVPDTIASLAVFQLFGAADTLLAFTGANLWYSSNGGVQWQMATGDRSWGPLPPNFVRVGADWYAASGLLMRSSDAGKTWTKVAGSSQAPSDLWAVARGAGGTLVCGAQSSGIFVSSDKGEGFRPFDTGLAAAMLFDVAVAEDTVYTWDAEGISRSRFPGLLWDTAHLTQTALPGVSFSAMALRGHDLFVWQSGASLLRGRPGGAFMNVTPPGMLQEGYFLRLHVRADTLMVLDEAGGFYHSVDAGNIWQKRSFASDFQPKDVAIQGRALFWAASQGLFRSTGVSGGEQLMASLPVFPARLWATDSALWCMAAQNPPELFVFGKNTRSWQTCSVPWSTRFQALSHPKVSFWQQGKALVAAFEGEGVFISRDGGLVWKDFNEGLPDARFFMALGAGERWLAAATGKGLFFRAADTVTETRNFSLAAAPRGFDLFPNPASVFLHIVNRRSVAMTALCVYDLSGNLVERRALEAPWECRLHVAERMPAAGVYRVEVRWSDGRVASALWMFHP